MNARIMLRALVRERARPLAIAGVCTAIMIGAMTQLPSWAGVLVRERIPRGDGRALALHLSIGVGLVLVLTAASFARDYTLMRLAAEIAASVRAKMMERALRQPLASLDSLDASILLSRASNDVAALQHALVRGLGVFAPNAIITLALLIALLATSWQLSLAVALLVLPMLLLVKAFGARLQVVVRGSQERLGDLVALLRDALDGAREIRAFGREMHMQSRLTSLGDDALARTLREERMAALHPAAVTFVGIAGIAALVFLATWMQRTGFVSTDALVRSLVLIGLVVGPLQESVRASSAVARCIAMFDRCAEALVAPIEDDDGALPQMPAMVGSVTLDDVMVTHGRRFTLGPIDLEIAAGEIVAIVGPSGAGKSTLLDVVAGLREPAAGLVRFDGRDARAHRRSSIRSQIALLTQEPFLFPGTVADNIRFGRLEATDDELRAAARVARIDDFIARLPDGYASHVERRGANLSVGQRQRIALARALVRDPAILLLDEPTSALDGESERLLVQSLRDARRGRTCIIVTHRPALLALADRVVELRDGRLPAERQSRELEERLA